MRLVLRSVWSGVSAVLIAVFVCSCGMNQTGPKSPVAINVVRKSTMDDGRLVIIYYEVDKPPQDVQDVDLPNDVEIENVGYKKLVISKEMSALVNECFANPARQLWASSTGGDEVSLKALDKPPK